MQIHKAAAILAAAGLALPAFAQDSVSNIANQATGGESDAISPWANDLQVAQYVLDLTSFTSSGGSVFAVGPVVKSSKARFDFETSVIDANVISPLATNASIGGVYALWNTRGAGVNPDANDAPGTVDGPAQGAVFSLGLNEFSNTDFGNRMDGLVGARVGVDPVNPTRLYVTRVVAGNSLGSAIDFDEPNSIGIGGIDALGNMAIRADDFGGGSSSWEGQALISLGDRANGTINDIDIVSGAFTVSDTLASSVVYQGIAGQPTLVIPNLVPESLGGPTLITTGFDSQYYYNNLSLSTFAHLGSSADQRGSLTVHPFNLLATENGVASASLLVKDGNGDTRAMSVWDIDATGAVVETPEYYELAGSISDVLTGYTIADTTTGELNNYRGSVTFGGPVGNTALGSDADGNLLAGTAYYFIPGNDGRFSMEQALVAVRDILPGEPGGEQWGVVAYTGTPNATDPFDGAARGKALLDDAGNEIGYIVTDEVIDGGGPSLVGGGFDAAGNMWFIAPVEYRTDSPTEADPIDPAATQLTLVRAIYDGTGNAPAWTLEKVIARNDVFEGQNSATNYRVSSIAFGFNGWVWGQSTMGDTLDGTVQADPADPRNLGGLVFEANITYDADGDGQYSFDDASRDESYSVLLFVGAGNAEPDCRPDYNDDGDLNTLDLIDFINDFRSANITVDYNGDGAQNTLDLIDFINDFRAGC